MDRIELVLHFAGGSSNKLINAFIYKNTNYSYLGVFIITFSNTVEHEIFAT